MAQEKIKCAVYKNEEEWGGGQYFLPAEHHEGIRNILREEGFKVARTPIGIFEFERSFLDQVFGRQTEDNFIYWDNTWCV